MTTDQIISLVIALCPDVIAILTMVGVVFRVIKEFRELKNQVTDMKAIEDLNMRSNQIMQENYELKKQINTLLTKIDHIERK